MLTPEDALCPRNITVALTKKHRQQNTGGAKEGGQTETRADSQKLQRFLGPISIKSHEQSLNLKQEIKRP